MGGRGRQPAARGTRAGWIPRQLRPGVRPSGAPIARKSTFDDIIAHGGLSGFCGREQEQGRRRPHAGGRGTDHPFHGSAQASQSRNQKSSSASQGETMLKAPLFWAAAAAVVALAIFAFVTEAPAYAGTAAETCANCHVMDLMYENYFHGGHRPWAECVDCHLPHDNPVSYYMEKGRQGMHDVYVFGTGQTPQLIRLSDHSRGIIQNNCVRCHEEAVESIMTGMQPFERDCWACHRSAAHGLRGAAMPVYQDSVLYPVQQGE